MCFCISMVMILKQTPVYHKCLGLNTKQEVMGYLCSWVVLQLEIWNLQCTLSTGHFKIHKKSKSINVWYLFFVSDDWNYLFSPEVKDENIFIYSIDKTQPQLVMLHATEFNFMEICLIIENNCQLIYGNRYPSRYPTSQRKLAHITWALKIGR